MNFPIFDFVEAQAVRRAVVADGDIRGDIGFQNDINVLLARLEGANPGLEALGTVREAMAHPVIGIVSARRRFTDFALRLVDGRPAAAPRGA